MNLLSRSIVGGVITALAGAAASAGGDDRNIFMSFGDPVGQREVRYIQPATAAGLGHITYNTSVPLNLSCDFSDFGLGGTMTPMKLTLDVDIGPASAGAQPNEYLAAANGTFQYRRASDNVLLITGSFTDASLSILRSSGGLTANGAVNMGQFDLVFTPAMIADFASAGYDFEGFDTSRIADASWTLTGLSPTVTLMTPPGSAEQFFANFNSNAAFSATVPVIIPSPGTIGLVLAAGLMGFGSRRR